MMGFIFYEPSPRNACALLPSVVNSLPAGIDRVGVFVDAPIEYMLQTAQRYGLTAVQLHGHETQDVCLAMRKAGLKVMKAIGVDRGIDWETVRPYEGAADMYVFDTFTASYGGSGKKFDWELLSDYPLDTPFLLSGGISPEDAATVCSAAASLPLMAGVDINSRFEIRPGKKDPSLVKKFKSLIQKH